MSDEKSSPEIASIAARMVGGGEYTDAEARRVAASCLAQAADKPKTEEAESETESETE